MKERRAAGIRLGGDMPWGTHACQFYETKDDLIELVVPFFKAGVEKGEFGLWVIPSLLTQAEAREALRRSLPSALRDAADRSLEVLSEEEWYHPAGEFNRRRVTKGWMEKLHRALEQGYAGLSVSGEADWARRKRPGDFQEYEAELTTAIAHRRMKILCTYAIGTSTAAELLDVARAHQLAVAIRRGTVQVLEVPELTEAKQALEERVLEQRQQLETANEELERKSQEGIRAEADFRSQKEILQTIFDHVPVMISFIDERGRIKLVNREWERVLGWTLEEVQGRRANIFEETYPDPEYRERVLQFFSEPSGEWIDLKTRIRDGRLIDTSWAAVHVAGTIVAIGQDVTARKHAESERARLFEQVRESRHRLQIAYRQLLRAHEDERRAIASELHDEIGQLLTAVSLTLTNSQEVALDLARARIEDAQALVGDLIRHVRSLALDLRPAMLDDQGLVSALTWLFERYTAHTNVSVRLEDSLPPNERFAVEVEIAAYRIVQESLTNVARHAEVAEVVVRLWVGSGALWVSIEDEGRGFDLPAVEVGASSGLRGMRERAALLDGDLVIDAVPGKGTRVTASLPLAVPASRASRSR